MVCNTIPLSDQWWATIENHQNQWLPDPKTIKNHWTQWLSQTIPFNGDGAFENHWNFAMVANCGLKSPISFDFVLSLQNDMETLTWSVRFICLLSLSSSLFVRKFKMWRLRAFFRSFERAKTIVDHRVRLWWKPLKNHWCQWSEYQQTMVMVSL